jgi:hypothetical protein
MKPLLLWTERPVPIARELETHAWMAEHREFVSDRCELVYDNAPGDWRHYSVAFHAVWRRARLEGRSLIDLESDVVPTEEAFDQLIACPEQVCMVPYELKDFYGRPSPGYSAVVEKKVPGGWDCHFPKPGEERAEYGDLGFVKFGPKVTQLDFDEVPDLAHDDDMLNLAIFNFLREKYRRYEMLHLHWPGLKNNHVAWDAGDYAHHGPGYVPPYDARLRTNP